MISNFLFQLIGRITVLIIIILGLLVIILFLLGKLFLKKDILILPKLILFASMLFYLPFKKLAKIFNKKSIFIDDLTKKIRNIQDYKKFKKASPEKTLIFLPHCLRDINCKANLTKNGLNCTKCGKCAIGEIKAKYEPQNYKIFIVPGSSFAKRILKENDCEAIFGIGCYREITMGLFVVPNYPTQTVSLNNSGCIETEVDLKKVYEILD